MNDLLQNHHGLTTSKNPTTNDQFFDVKQVTPCLSESSEPPAPEQFREVPGIKEILRTGPYSSTYSEMKYQVETRDARNVDHLMDRWREMLAPMSSIPLPTGPKPYGTTTELFTRIHLKIAEQTQLSDSLCALLTFWIFSTWFHEAVSIAPCLAITGSPYEGDVVLRTLRTFCYRPMLLIGSNRAVLKGIDWYYKRTLLISAPNLDNQMAALVGSSTSPGYMTLVEAKYCDLFGSKALYLGEDLPMKMKSMLQHCVHIHATATLKAGTRHAPSLSNETIQDIQNQLLQYRMNNLPKLYRSWLNAPELSAETHAIAKALGSCMIDAPDLQAKLVSLLTPYAAQQIAERSDSLEALTVGATLRLSHKGKGQIFAREIAAEVNRMQEERGQTLPFNPEKAGHKLKKVGLLTRRLSQAGNGLIMDHPTVVLIHELAADYSMEDVSPEAGNMHCPLCERNQASKEAM
jgi:hypothetical protein